ncbi:helix-turn-helix domain-containing protein [Roseibium litorale]|uniref:Helix-turn-helix domain-containing protein n=1 Tax=Roseibium litorale TaxID=2803841 RepID=A0ABR9CJB1_9HYPH|nr:helix-turn-helix domain-containing protein [Roseibium litorale]MBD8890930.1 helix-turn-helix domain-containing protein [Roseibium litorale]
MAKPKHVPPNGWDRFSIVAEIHRQSMTLGELASRAGITIKTFSQVWTRANRKAETAIADFLVMKPAELWPERYPIRTTRILSSTNGTRLERRKADRSADSNCDLADREAA